MKYGNRKITTKDGTFDSMKEHKRWCELKLLQRAGEISKLRRQIPFVLIPKQTDEKGKTLERECRYVADFVYEENGQTVVEDVKSVATKTPEYRIKKKLLLERYGIRIVEV